MARPTAIATLLLALLPAALGCADGESAPARLDSPPPAGPERAEVAIAGRVFRLELALDRPSRYRGLSGRGRIEPEGGMLFVHRSPQPLAMVMRDCPEPIDVAFLDGEGRVLALHAMRVEPPRAPDEGRAEYEARLPVYPSRRPAVFAVEVAGGSLGALGVRVGDRFFFETDAIRARAR